MRSRNLTIEYVSNQVGFNSRSSFREAFKDITGITPTNYLILLATEKSNTEITQDEQKDDI